MDDHLGYEKSQRSDSDDYRNGYKTKRVNSSYGTMEIEVPQDRRSSLSLRLFKSVRKIFPILTVRSYPCMQRNDYQTDI